MSLKCSCSAREPIAFSCPPCKGGRGKMRSIARGRGGRKEELWPLLDNCVKWERGGGGGGPHTNFAKYGPRAVHELR